MAGLQDAGYVLVVLGGCNECVFHIHFSWSLEHSVLSRDVTFVMAWMFT